MKEETIIEMSSPYRDSFRIRGFRFGEGEETIAIVGPMRGDEVQQQYISSKLVHELSVIESRGEIVEGKSILVIPSCNPFSLNVNHRFWAMDGTDINRMFPGYDKGETTQRIASAVFQKIKDFKYGMQLASYYVPGEFIPHVRMLKTGYEAVEDAKLFGMPYITVRKPLPFDTTLLNYNWQIWESRAFSIYAGTTEHIDETTSRNTLDAIVRFCKSVGCITHSRTAVAYQSVFLDEKDLINIQSSHAGILQRILKSGDRINTGDIMARIIDPLRGDVLEEVKAPCNGIIFFSYHRPLIYQNALLYKLQELE